MYKVNAPLLTSTPQPPNASPAPVRVSQNGAWTRRAVLVSALGAALPASAQSLTLEAGPSGYNGVSPGPPLRGRPGVAMRLTLANKLAEPTSLRLFHQNLRFAAGETRDIAFTPEAPGFDLYGAFLPGQFSAGLYGAIVIEENSAPPVDLDSVVVITPSGPALALAAPQCGRVRLRIVSALPDQALMLEARGAAAQIIAVDGRPCEPFTPRDGRFPLCPGARIELLIDLDSPFDLLSDRPLAHIAPEGAGPKRAPFAKLPADPRLPEEIALERALQVRLTVTDTGFKAAAKPLFSVKRGTPVTLTLTSAASTLQTLRLDGHAARILHNLDDGWDPYWRDRLPLAPGQTLHAAFVAGHPGDYALEAFSPERAAKGLSGTFVVK